MPTELTATVPYMNLTITLHFATSDGRWPTVLTGVDVDADPGTELSNEVWDSIDWDVLTLVGRRKITAVASRKVVAQ